MSQQKPDFRLDHTMIRVFDQDKTLDFYTRILGMKILRQNEYPDGRFTNTFVGYQGEDEGFAAFLHRQVEAVIERQRAVFAEIGGDDLTCPSGLVGSVDPVE